MSDIKESHNRSESEVAASAIQAETRAAPCLTSPEAREARLRNATIVSAERLYGSHVRRPKRNLAPPAYVEVWQQKPMAERQIEEAIKNAEGGIAQYLKIMELVPESNVAVDRDFQRKFNAFYRVMKRPPEWYETYFSFMEQRKQRKPTFDETLGHLWNALGTCEPSFSSKLVATLDPHQPIWDAIVLRNIGIPRPRYGSETRLTQSKETYHSLCDWYERFLGSENGRLIVLIFNQKVAEHAKITDLKKIDFVLWKTTTQP